MSLPRAVLLDLDDTILDDSGNAERCWREACDEHARDLNGVDPGLLHDAIESVRSWFWSDPDRHRAGRLDLQAAYRDVVRLALERLGVSSSSAAEDVAVSYRTRREAEIKPFERAIDTVEWLRSSGCRLALLTNGAGAPQRSKVDRFGLAPLFDLILIEGELGYGKPDPRVYRRALADLDVAAGDAWMVGDNLEWDVAEPQRQGVFSIWIDRWGTGLPLDRGVRPDRIIRHLWELRDPAVTDAPEP